MSSAYTAPRFSTTAQAALFLFTTLLSHPGAAEISGPQFGTTVITHGYQFSGTLPTWPTTLANALRTRAGGGRVFQYEPDSGDLDLIAGSINEIGETIVICDWAEESNDSESGRSEAAAEAILAAVLDHSSGPTPLIPRSPLHLIGHSRGTVVNSEIAERLIANGIDVDHVTTLDPHDWGNAGIPGVSNATRTDWDVNSWHPEYPRYDFFDEMPGIQTWEGIGFADNYYQERGNNESITNLWGKFLPGAANLNFIDTFGIGHSDVHAWYHGTVDTVALSDGAGIDISSSWYDNPGGHTECNASLRDWSLNRMTDGFWFSYLGGWTPSHCPESEYAPGVTRVNVGFSYKLPEGLVNGDFDRGISGWMFHGGQIGDGAAIGNGVLDLNLSVASGSMVTATHNRFYIPPSSTHIRLCMRVVAADSDDRLRVKVGSNLEVNQPVNLVTSACSETTISMGPYPNTVQTLTFELVGNGSGTARVFIDNVAFLPSDLLLLDGFETGNTSGWTIAIP